MTIGIFITGITGYIGGDAFHALHQAHPEYEYAALVRTQDKADQVKAKYPNVRIVLGGLDDAQVLRDEASKADIVLHTADASDHEGAATSIAAGLVAGHSASKPGFWLHTGGTGILTYVDSDAGRLGVRSEKQYDDLDGVAELTNLPDKAFHRNIDKIVLECGTQHAGSVKTAIVCPPTIYGKGRGPVSGRGRQVYELASLVLRKGYAPIIGEGKARWNNVHVADLSDAYVLLVEAAVAGNTSDEVWGPRGYHFTENGEHVWGDLSRAVAAKAKGLGFIERDPKDYQMGKEEALEVAGFEALSWGFNSRGKAGRLTKYLGWKPHRVSIVEHIPVILKAEKERL